MRIRNTFVKISPFLVFGFFTFLISRSFIGDIVSINDFPYFWPNSSIDSFSTWWSSYLGTDRTSTMFAQQLLFLVPRIFNRLGFSDQFISYVHNFGLIYLCSLVYFFIAKKVSSNYVISFFSGFFIVLNNFVLEHLLIWPGIIFYSLVMYGLTFFIFYKMHLYGVNFQKVSFIVFFSFFHMHPFFFIIHLIFSTIFIIFYFIEKRNLIKKSDYYLFITLIIGSVFIQSYWLLPFIKNILVASPAVIYGKDIFNNIFSGYYESTNYLSLSNLNHYSGNVANRMHPGLLTYFFYSSLMSLVMFLFLKRESKNDPWIIFLFFLTIAFFLLSLGPKFVPIKTLWLYFFNNVSFFGFFRSFTRFIILYLVMLNFTIVFLLSRWRYVKKNWVILIFIIFLFFSHKIFFTGNLGGFVNGFKLPNEYRELNRKFFNNSDENYNILLLPNIKYESYTWSKNIKNTNDVNLVIYFREYFFSKPVFYNRVSFNPSILKDFLGKILMYGDRFEFPEQFKQIIDKMSVKYILVQKDLIDMEDEYSVVSVEKYLTYLNNSEGILLVEENEHFALYENKDYFPIVLAQNAAFKKMNGSKYSLLLQDVGDTRRLGFLQRYHSDWSLFLERFPKSDYACNDLSYFKSLNIKECASNHEYLNLNDIKYLYKESVFENSHRISKGYANEWDVDYNYIKNNFPSEYYKENSDGTIDIVLTIFFRSQAYFYLGSVFTLFTLSFCLFYNFYTFIKSKKKDDYLQI